MTIFAVQIQQYFNLYFVDLNVAVNSNDVFSAAVKIEQKLLFALLYIVFHTTVNNLNLQIIIVNFLVGHVRGLRWESQPSFATQNFVFRSFGRMSEMNKRCYSTP